MKGSRLRVLLTSLVPLLLTVSELHAQTPEQASLVSATAEALEPGVRAALRGGQAVSFEHRSPWGQAVKSRLEASLGVSLTAEHRRGAGRILLGTPRFDADTAFVEVWFGRCEAHADGDAEVLKIRMYSFTFRRDGQDWSHLRASRLGTTEGSCDGEWRQPPSVQT